MKRQTTVLLALAFSVAGYACDEPAGPARTADIAYEVQTRRDTGPKTQDLFARVTVSHQGGAPIVGGRSCWWFIFHLIDQEGNYVQFRRPIELIPCRYAYLQMLPGETVVGDVHIDGRIWDDQGIELSLSPGTYYLHLYFSYHISGSDELHEWLRIIEFDWE